MWPDFLPHRSCYLNDPKIIWTEVITNFAIFVSYMVISALLARTWKAQRKSVSLMTLLFGLFIFGCGLTHLTDIMVVWFPFYWTDAVVRFFTAAASVYTAMKVFEWSPMISNIVDIESGHARLTQEIEALKTANEELAVHRDLWRKMVESKLDDAELAKNYSIVRKYLKRVDADKAVIQAAQDAQDSQDNKRDKSS